MSDSTLNSVGFPSPIPDSAHTNDTRPLPELIAEHYGFPLAYHDVDGKRWYAIQDWIAGVGQTADPRVFLALMKRRFKKAGIELFSWCKQLPYLASNGRRYKMDHATDQGLYQITQRMDANTGLRNAVLTYLAKSGVVIDEIRIDPEKAIDAAIDAYKKMGKSDKWITARLQSKAMRIRFTSSFSAVLKEKPQPRHFGIITDTMRVGLWRRTTAKLKTQMNLDKNANLRDNMSSLALTYEQLAENVSAVEMERHEREKLSFEETQQIVKRASERVGKYADDTADFLGIDIATDQPLLK